jgi:hypothetical protein
MSDHLKAFKINLIWMEIAVEEEEEEEVHCPPMREVDCSSNQQRHTSGAPQLAISCGLRWRFLYKMFSRATSSNSQYLSGVPFIRKVFIST